MATIDDFGAAGQSLQSPPLGGPDGWAAAVRDEIRRLQAGFPHVEVGTVEVGAEAASELIGDPSTGYEWNLTLPPVAPGSVSVAALEFSVTSFGAVGNGLADDTAAIQEAIDAAAVAGGTVSFPPGVYLISDTLRMKRGVILSGASTFDSERAATILLADDANCSMLQTPLAAGGAATHYMILRDLRFDGNASGQTESTVGIDWAGSWVGTSWSNVAVHNVRGTAVALDTVDGEFSDVWILGTVAEDAGNAGLTIGNRTGVGQSSSLLTFTNLYVENTTNTLGGDPRNVPADRATNITIKNTNKVAIFGLHCEGGDADVEILENVRLLAIGGFTSSHTSTCLRLTQDPRSLHISGWYIENLLAPGYVIESPGVNRSVPSIADSSGAWATPLFTVTGGAYAAAARMVTRGNAPALTLIANNERGLQVDIERGGGLGISALRKATAAATNGGLFAAYGKESADAAFVARVDGDTDPRIGILSDGVIRWGPGSGAPDCSMYRGAAGQVRVDGQFRVYGSAKVETDFQHVGASGGKVGFWGATPIAKPTVTGSRGGNAALQSLLSALANLGLLTDSSTA